MLSRINKVLFGLGLAAVALIAVLAYQVIRFQQPLAALQEPQVFQVAPGSSLTRIANALAEQGIYASPLTFRLAARLSGVEADLQSGEYRFDPGLSASDLLAMMVAGEIIQYRVTLLEGWTLSEALNELFQQEQLQITLENASPSQLAAQLDLQSASAEGMLHPDTYFYTRGTTDLEVLRRARSRQEMILQSHWEDRLGALPYATPYEALIMASIIEKESAASSEREKIAGVFVRRLEQGMRLQSDPTVIYGIGASFDGNLTRDHLQTTTAYNTYRIDGLPPTPIALPGEASIIASLNPQPGDALYFVSRGDGTHYFSATLEEHNNAVNRFQRSADTEIEDND